MVIVIHKKGNLTADGTEQTVTEITTYSILSGYISMSNMEIGDIVTIRQYMNINDNYEMYNEEIYSNKQTTPILHITPKTNLAMKITLQQTAGTLKLFNTLFLKEIDSKTIQL